MSRMKHCCFPGVHAAARWRCGGTGANSRQVPASSGTEGAIGSIRQFGAWPDNVGKDSSNVCFGVGSCHCRYSLWRSHGEGDRSVKASGGGAATPRHRPSVSPGLDRKSVVKGKGVSVRCAPGGCGTIKKKKQ